MLRTTYQGLTLDRFQQEALAGIDAGHNVIVAAPTGAGKTLIANYALEQALAQGKRAIYTAPIKALSNQKYRDLQEVYPDQVGISTGDLSVNSGAPIVIMTTEIFRNTIFDAPERLDDVAWLIFDEVHYLDDPERGTVWEESLIFAPPQVKVVALSATVSNLEEFAAWIENVRESPVDTVIERKRPVPLQVFLASTEKEIRPLKEVRKWRLNKHAARARFRKRVRDLRGYYARAQRELVEQVAEREELPMLFFLFSRKATETLAEDLARQGFAPSQAAGEAARAEFQRLAAAFELDPRDPALRTVQGLVERGVAFHHAGVLPALKEVIERLFAAGHLQVLCATETFALGVNMPARSVAFEGVTRWNGKCRAPLKTREYQQMAGRAGRRGIDAEGSVYLTFDPFRDDPQLHRSTVYGTVEPVNSQFNLSYGTLLNLYQRLGEGIFAACERSFANFRAQRQERGPKRREKHTLRRREEREERSKRVDRRRDKRERQGRGRRGRRARREELAPKPQERPKAGYAGVIDQLRLRLDLLRELGYLDSQDRVSKQGTFAMAVFGHELEISELVFGGVLKGLTPGKLAVVLAAVVFEARKNVYYSGVDPRHLLGKRCFRNAEETLGRLVGREEDLGIRTASKLLDWNLSGVVHAWVEGATFAELKDYTDASDGDIVRALRQTIQALRLIVRPLRALGQVAVADNAQEAMRLLKRDLVDAEWQLRRAAELEALDLDPAEFDLVRAESREAPATPDPSAKPSPDPEPDEFSAGLLPLQAPEPTEALAPAPPERALPESAEPCDPPQAWDEEAFSAGLLD